MKASQSLLQVFQSRKMAALLLLGFSSGLPLYLTSRTLQAWMQEEKVDLASIGLFSLVGLPYSLKFLRNYSRHRWLTDKTIGVLSCMHYREGQG